MALHVYVYGLKRGENTLLAHGGTIPEEHWTGDPSRKGRKGELLGHPAKKLGPLLRAFDGKDPAELLIAARQMVERTPREERWLLPYLYDVLLACEHWQRLKSHRHHGELYDTAKVVVTTA